MDARELRGLHKPGAYCWAFDLMNLVLWLGPAAGARKRPPGAAKAAAKPGGSFQDWLAAQEEGAASGSQASGEAYQEEGEELYEQVGTEETVLCLMLALPKLSTGACLCLSHISL